MKSLHALLILLILSGLSGFGQKPKTDSIPVMRRLLKEELPPETRLRYLSKICVHYWNSNPDSSIWYGRQGLSLYTQQVSQSRIGRHNFVYGMAWENKGNYDSALHYLSMAERVCFEAGDTLYAFRAIEQTGSLFRIMGRYDTAIQVMNRALDYFKSAGNNYQTMSTLFNIGSVYLEQNRFSKALHYYLKSSEFDSILGDPSGKAIHLLGIGNIYLSLAELFKPVDSVKARNYLIMSSSYFRQSIDVFRSIDMKTGYCFGMMSLLSSTMAMGEFSRADSILTSCTDCLMFPDPRIRSGFAVNRAELLVKRGKDKEALEILSETSRDKGEIRILPDFHKSMLLYATLLWNTGQRDTAVKLVTTSLAWAKSHSVKPLVIDALVLLADWNRKQGKNEQAFDLLASSRVYKDSMYREISNETFDQIELKFRNQLLKAELSKLVISEQYHRTKNLVTILGALLLIVSLGIISFILYLRRRAADFKRRQAEEKAKRAEEEAHLKEIEIQKINLEKQLKNEEMEKIQLEMKLKEQELVYQTILNADLNQKNLTFAEKLGPFRLRIPKKKDQEEFAQTLSDICRESQVDPMQSFDLLFKQMHSGFLEKLLEICPDLTKTELQICSILRLNLSSKDIARLLNISPASIDGTRHRIRKKLNIDPNTSLTSFLMTLK